MEASIAPRGLIADLITPLKSDGSIDGRGLGKLLDRTVPSTQAVLLASPHIGEGENLALDHRIALLEIALAVIRGQAPILIWVTQGTEKETKETILVLRELLLSRKYAGQVFWVDSPLYYHSNRGLPSHFQDLCAIVDQPFILYNDPQLIKGLPNPLKRKNIRTGILKELICIRGITGLIFSGSLDRTHNYQRVCRRRTHFRIYDGDETRFLNHPSMGGVVSAGANLAPKAWQTITRSSLQLTSDQKSYPDYLQQVWELGEYLRNLKDLYQPTPVAIIKGILSDIGIIETAACTFPTQDVEEAKRLVKELMACYGNHSEQG